jgi:hypothetical protein
MESNPGGFSKRLNYPSQKRKSPPELNSTNDEDFRLPRSDSSELLRQLETRNQQLEARIDRMNTQFNTMISQNHELKSQVQNLQKQYRELESRINELGNQDVPRQMKPSNPIMDQLTKDFEKRFDLVEIDNQDLTERLDSCQQNFAKKSVSFENELVNLQQRLNNFEIHDTDMQHNETIPTQQLTEGDTYRNASTTVKTKLTVGELNNDNNGCDLIEQALCTPCESQIQLSTDQVQYGLFDFCDKYNVILHKENDKLILFDHQKIIDERPWGEPDRNNYVTCIHWCSFLDTFLILYRFKLCSLSLKQNPKTLKMEFDKLETISSIRVYSIRHDTTNRTGNSKEILRFITTSPNKPGYMYLNRGYRRIELVNTNSWKAQRGWSKHDLDYGEQDEIRSIKWSYDGTYLAINIKLNHRVGFIDLRKHDGQMTLMKTIRMPNDSASLSHRVQIPFGQYKWLIIDENNQCYKVSADPTDKSIIPIRTDHVQAIENVQIRLCFALNHRYLLVGEVIGDHKQKHGMFRFYKLPAYD